MATTIDRTRWTKGVAILVIVAVFGCGEKPTSAPQVETPSTSAVKGTAQDVDPVSSIEEDPVRSIESEPELADTEATNEVASSTEPAPASPTTETTPPANNPDADAPESPSPASPATGTNQSSEQGDYEVVLQSFDNKLLAIKITRAWTDFGLREAKDLVESAPNAVIKTQLTQERATKLQAELEQTGAKVIVRKTTVPSPSAVVNKPVPTPSENPAANPVKKEEPKKWPEIVDGIPLLALRDVLAEIEKDEDAAKMKYSSRMIMVRGPVETLEDNEGDLYVTLAEKNTTSFAMAHGFSDRKKVEAELKPGETITILGMADILSGSVSLSNSHTATDDDLKKVIEKFTKAPKFEVVIEAYGHEENLGSAAYVIRHWSANTLDDAGRLLKKLPVVIVSEVTRETANRVKAEVIMSCQYRPGARVSIRKSKKRR